MTQALVTGASGFIGGHLVAGLLRRGYQVRCLVRKTSSIAAIETTGSEVIRGALDQPRLTLEPTAAIPFLPSIGVRFRF